MKKPINETKITLPSRSANESYARVAVAAFVASLCAAPLWLQIGLFIVVSGAALIFTRPLAVKYLNPSRKATNADRVLNMVGVVSQRVDNIRAQGMVTVAGKVWSARSASGQVLPEGALVRPVRIEGVKLIVLPVDQAEE